MPGFGCVFVYLFRLTFLLVKKNEELKKVKKGKPVNQDAKLLGQGLNYAKLMGRSLFSISTYR